MAQDPVDSRLRERLVRLSSAVPDDGAATVVRTQRRSSLPVGLLAILALVAVGLPIAANVASTPEKGAPAAPSGETAAPSVPVGSLPPGGITEAEAVDLARAVVSKDAVLRGAKAGLFDSVRPTQQRIGPDYPVRLDRPVWAVEFDDQFQICPPDGSECGSPRPGTTTVTIDYLSGEVLSTFGYSEP